MCVCAVAKRDILFPNLRSPFWPVPVLDFFKLDVSPMIYLGSWSEYLICICLFKRTGTVRCVVIWCQGLSFGRPFFIFASEGSSESSAFMLFVFVPCLSLFLLLILTFNVFFYLATASMWPHVWLNLINMSVIIQEYIGYHGHSFYFNFIKFYKYPKGICYSTCVIEINDFPFNFFL